MQGLSRLGATKDEWRTFAVTLGLREDLLPAVAKLDAQIAPGSKLGSLGKTPSRYGGDGYVWGIGSWVEKHSTAAEVAKWSEEPDYSICCIARRFKAIDCDITDPALAGAVRVFIADFLWNRFGIILPERSRANSSKFLLGFMCQQPTLKRVLRLEHGIIEFLGDRQQFLVAGTHDSGVRYQWSGLENPVASLTLEQFDQLWTALEVTSAVAPSVEARGAKHIQVDTEELILQRLTEKGMVLSQGRDGSYNITCPFEHEHSTESVESATVYWPAHTGGYAHPSIKCLHAHCAERSTEQFKIGLGFELTDGFEDLGASGGEEDLLPPARGDASMFKLVPAISFANDGVKPSWLVKNLLPAQSFGQIYGPPGGGKTFAVFDIIASIARGVPWRGRKVTQGAIVYICAEGAYFFRRRIQAYQLKNDLNTHAELPVYVLDGQPNLMDRVHVKNLAASIEALDEPIACVVLDTYANCMVGDENSGTDVGKVIANCKWLIKALQTSVMLVHHAGKDASRGARGWSGMRGAVDYEFMVTKEEGCRVLRNTKQKDGEDGLQFAFDLESVGLGVDEDGDVIESCVVVESKIVPLAAPVREDKASVRERVLFALVQELRESTGQWPDEAQILERAEADGAGRASDLRKALDGLLNRGLLDKGFDDLIRLAE